MSNIKKTNIFGKSTIITMLLFAIILAIATIIFFVHIKNSQNKLEEKEIFNQGYAIYINGGNGTYSPASAFPIGSYELNVARTTCASGASLNDVLYNSALGVLTFKTNRPDRCNYYFDKVQQIYNNEYIDYTTKGLETGALMNFTYQGSVKSITLPAGTYQLEVWGAGVNATKGANGGYSKGTITFSGSQVLYLAVGQAGSTANNVYNKKSFNGGGAAGSITSMNQASGGGASHIATADGVLSSLENNKGAIIIVAGGGAGWIYGSYTYTGGVGHGGGTNGTVGGYYRDDSSYSYTLAGAGTQTAGGAGSVCQTTDTERGSAGSFGQGGDGSLDSTAGGNGGGGGYYGGGGGCYNYYWMDMVEVTGSGGSGYISPSLTNASTTSETTSTSPGADKNGYIRITML